MVLGSLLVGHDGSYQVKLAKDVCAGAVVIRCKWTGKMATCAWTERTNDKTANNYRGEILGGIVAQLLLRAAMEGHRIPSEARVRCGCDNMGVVGHGKEFWRPLQEKQTQADVLRVLKKLISTAPVRPELFHVYGHQDRYLRLDQLDEDAETNRLADDLVDENLVRSVADEKYIKGVLPFDDVRLSVGAKRVTGSPTEAIVNFWGSKVARDLFHSRKIIHRRVFNMVYWDGVEAAMKEFPELFRVWVTKQVSHFCGTNRQLSKIDPTVENVCPSCGGRNETTSHITRCPEEGRTVMFRKSVAEIVDWLEQRKTDESLTKLIEQYLLGRGKRSMRSVVGADRRFLTLARIHDSLGWDNFVEGRICKLWLQFREVDINRRNLRTTSESWAWGLSHRLLQLTHRQWIYRNSVVHYKVQGITMRQHERIMDNVEHYAMTDPEDLLPENRHLLDIDFEALGEASSIEKQFWVAEMETAVAASDHVKQGTVQALRSRYGSGAVYDTRRRTVSSMKDSEGSLRWRRRRKRGR